MKIIVNIPEIKTSKELLVVSSENDKKIIVENLSSQEKTIYDNFIKLTENADLFEIGNAEIDVYIHRICSVAVSKDKYIDYQGLQSSDKKKVDDFIELVKNKQH